MIQVKWYDSIQFKLQFFICLVFILSVGAILASNYINDKNNLEQSLHQEMQNRYSQVLEHINNASLRALSLSLWVANTTEIQTAFGKQDRQALQDITSPIYERIKTDSNINQFQFHLPPATSFLRLHKLGKHGDDLSGIRPTIVAANTEKKPIRGLDKGRFGFGIRGVSPMVFQNDHIGCVEFGVSLNDQFLERLKQLYDSHVAILDRPLDTRPLVVAKNFAFADPDILLPEMAAWWKTAMTGLIMVSVTGSCSREDEIRIGFAGQLTGVFSDLGVQGRNGSALAVEEINAGMAFFEKMAELFRENRFMFEIERKRAIEQEINRYEDSTMKQKLWLSQKEWDRVMANASEEHNRFVLIQMLFWDLVRDAWLPALNSLGKNDRKR
ncbi:MAG TPA: cache domain-containing protein [Desulfotignum sp.]|nr:cache domain-containing protein [Desulfotignum sp.]